MADFTWDDIEDAATEQESKGSSSNGVEKPEPQGATGGFTWDDVEEPAPTPMPEVRGETAAASAPVVETAPAEPPKKPRSLIERLADNDIDDAIAEKAEKNSSVIVQGSGIGMPTYSVKRDYNDKAKMDDLVEIANEAGLEDWQVKRIREEAKTPDEMREALKFVAGNRVKEGAVDAGEGEERTWGKAIKDNILSPIRGLSHAILDRIPGIIRLGGTILGGKSDAAAPEMVDDLMAKQEGESFDHWYKRVKFNPMEKQRGETGKQFAERIAADGKIREYAEQYFKWEAPIAGKEGMRPTSSLAASGNMRKRWSEKSLGDKLVEISEDVQTDLEKAYPRHQGDNVVMNFVEDTISGVGGFVYAGPVMVAESYGNAYQATRDEAKRNGLSDEEANRIGRNAGAFDATMTAVFYAAPFRRWAKQKNINLPVKFKSGAYSDMKASVGNYYAKKAALDQGIAALEASAIMGVQGAGDEAFNLLSQGKEIDVGDVVLEGVKGAANGAAIALVMGGAHVLGARRRGGRDYDSFINNVKSNPDGIRSLARVNPDGTAAFCEAYERGGEATAEQADKAGIPPMDAEGRKSYYNKLKNLGITSESIRGARRLKGPLGGEEGGETISATVTPPPSEQAARMVEAEGEKPVGFTIPTTADGAPRFAVMSVRDKQTGEVKDYKVAADERSGVAIMDNGDGTFTAYDNEGNAVDSNSLESAIENANTLANGNQLAKIERGKKREVIEGVLQDGSHDGVQADYADSYAAARSRGDMPEGTSETAAYYKTADGKTVFILDNIEDPSTVAKVLDIGTKNDRGAFADGVTFKQETEQGIDGNTVTTRVARDEAHGVTIVDNGDKTFTVFDQKGNYADASSLEEAVAVANGAKPKPKKETRNETRNGADEAQPQSEEGAAGRQGQKEPEVARPQPEEPSRGEAPREGVVEPSSRTPEVGVSKNAKTTSAKADTADLEQMIADADPDLESAKAAGDTKAFTEALDAKGFSPEERNGFLDRFYETHPTAARRARVEAKQTLKSPTSNKTAKDFAQHLIDKYAPDGQTVKAKRDASRAATMERAEAVAQPEFLANDKAGNPATRIGELTNYLADGGHNLASLHKAITSVQGYFDAHKYHLGFFKTADKTALLNALDGARKRLAKMRDESRAEFGQKNADLPKDLVERYIRDGRKDSLLARWLENGSFFTRPRSASAAKAAVGVRNPLVDAKYDGKLFDPNAEGADELNNFFNGMPQKERDKWLRVLFGKGTKEVTEPVVTGNDLTLEKMGLSMDEALDAIRDEYNAFQKWRAEGAEDEEARYYREQYEAEQKDLDETFGPITDYRISELEERGMADLEYANAKAFVYNRADGNDFAIVTPSALEKAEEGDIIQFDHLPQFFSVLSYDAKNGILTVLDATGENPVGRAFRVTENDISEINRETKNDKPAETGTSDTLANDARGSQARRGEEEEGGSGGYEVRAAESSARTGKADAYRRVAEAIDLAWQGAHPDEVKNLVFPVSAVTSNPLVKGGATDAVSWPIDATKIDNQEDAANLFRVISDVGYEITKVLYVDDFGNITGRKVVSIGTVGNVNVNFGDIFSKVPKDTTGVIFSHNHPAEQGDEVKPSESDGPVTQNLKAACEENGLKLYDHIVTDHNAYYSYAAANPSYVSEGAAKFWEQADVFGGMVEKPADTMNIVPYGKRIDLTEGTLAKLNGMAALVSKQHDSATWVAGIDDRGKVVWVDAVPNGGDLVGFVESHKGARRYAVLNGADKIDMPSFVDAIESGWNGMADTRPLVVATGENGEVNAYDPNGLNDQILAASKPAAPAANAPRLANAPKLEGDAQKAGLDILDELGGFLKAPVSELERGENIEKLRNAKDIEFKWENQFALDKDAARAWLRKNVRGTYVNAGTGEKINVVRGGIRKVTSHGMYSEAHLKSTAAIPQLIRDSVFITEMGPTKADAEYDKYRYFVAGLNIDGTPYMAKMVVGVKNGEQYYDHDLTQISKGDLLDALRARVTNPAASASPLDGVNDTKLLEILQPPTTVDAEVGLRSAVEPLDREEFKRLRDVAERLMDHLSANGYGTFDDMVRFIAANRPEVYERLKDPLRRAWNMNVLDPADEISFARGNEIYGKIDNELKETTNDITGNGQDSRASGTGERNRTLGAETGAGGTGGGNAGPQAVSIQDGGGLPSDIRTGRGADGEDAGVDGGREGTGRRPGVGGDADRARSELGSGSVRDGDVQRDSERTVLELTEVTPGFSEYEPPADLPVKAPKSQSLIVESSALASIQPPKIKSKPDIPDSIPEKGILQAHQYQTVCQVVNANNEKLPNGQRQGYLCGDGTGAGKTRIIAGVMLDAVNRKLGDGKALIISKDVDLFQGAKSDFEPFGIADRLFRLDLDGMKRLVQDGRGIAFTTYASLAENYSGTDKEGNILSAGKKGKSDNRFAEIVKWLGKDFDGVIALDEAHSVGKGELDSDSMQATRAAAAIDLQNALPNARVLYLTATAAYDANHLKFLTRAGLWGEGTGFRTFSDFANAVNQGGLSMMEILTQGLKAKGLYCSRSISFKGVKCDRVVAQTTPEQKETYSQYSDALTRIHDAALEVGSITGTSVRAQSRQYFSRMLDLFNSLITSMKVQKAIELGKQAIEDGKSPVFQIIMTNESARNAKAAKQPKRQTLDLFGNVIEETPVEADEVEVGVKDRILAYLNGGGFPVRENLGKENGVQQWGEEIPEAVALRDEMIDLVNALPDIANPIDELTKAFANVGISRITGKSNKNAEAAAFNNGENLALVFSGAGGTGASYHADRRFKNQRQRVQIPIEFGWEPEKFLQALGRSHRNNQVVPPEFVLLTTDIAGEMRFMSTIANRVASMGAIVGGDRNSSGQVVSATDSVDTQYGRAAIREVIRELGAGQRIGDMPAQDVIASMFLNPNKLDEVEPTKFLGRLQFLPIDQQSAIYNEIADRIERSVAAAKADGTYDDGIRKIDANRLSVKASEPMSTGETEGQSRSLITTSEWYDSRRIDHEALEARAPEGRTVEYVRNKRSGRLYGLFQNGQNLVRLAPDGSYETILPLERGNYETVSTEDGRKAWDAEFEKLPAEVERIKHYMAGDLIPVWDKIGIEGRPYVYRAQPQGAKPFIGLYISDAQLPITLFGFGKKEEARKFFKENGYRLVTKDGAKFNLASSYDPSIGQPYFTKMKIGTRNVLAVVHAEGTPVEADLVGDGWQGTWAKDETDAFDRGGQVYYRDFGDEAEAAFDALVKKFGVVKRKNGGDVVFSSKDGLEGGETAAVPPRRPERPSRGTSAAPNPDGRTLAERLGMPEMRMRVENGQVYITNTDARHRNDLKLAFGGQWANRVRDGKRYVKSDLRWNQDAVGRNGYWSIPLDKVPPQLLAEIEGSGELRSTVAPLESVAEMEREGGLVRLAQNPTEFKTTLVNNILRAHFKLLEDPRLVATSDAELIRRAFGEGGTLSSRRKPLEGEDAGKEGRLISRATDGGDLTALAELEKRYMGDNAKSGGVKGLIRRKAAKEGMAWLMTESRLEEIASLVWSNVRDENGVYELKRDGVVADFVKGNTAIYRNTKSLIPAIDKKIEFILKDMRQRWNRRADMLDHAMVSTDLPNPSRENETIGESIPEDADLMRERRNRIKAMEMVDKLMRCLSPEMQDIFNTLLQEESERGNTSKSLESLSKKSIDAAQAASGLSRRVFAYRYRSTKEVLQSLWNYIKGDEIDEEIEKEAREKTTFGDTDEEINEDIVSSLENESDIKQIGEMLLEGQAVEDIAEALGKPRNVISAQRAKLKKHGVTLPKTEREIALEKAEERRRIEQLNHNSLGLEMFPAAMPRETMEEGRIEQEQAAGLEREKPTRSRKPANVAWTPDLFAAMNATVDDVQNDKISEGLAAGASDEQIAEDVGVSPDIVKLARIRESADGEGRVVAPKSVTGTSGFHTEQRYNPETGHFEEVPVYTNTDGSTERAEGPITLTEGKPTQASLFAPVSRLEQGTLGIPGSGFEGPLGYTNAAANEWRSEHGFAEIAKKAKVSLDDLNKQGAAMANNTREMDRMVERLTRAPYAVSPVEQVALGHYVVNLSRQYDKLHAQKQEAFSIGNEPLAASIDVEAQEVFNRLDAAQRVNNRVVGNQLGLAMRARQLTVNNDGSIADYMISCMKAKGGALTKGERAQAEKLFAQLDKANIALDEATTAAMIDYLDAVSKRRLAEAHDEVKERKKAKQERDIERDYFEALAQIRYHGERRSGGTLHGLPGGQKWIRALEAYHLMNGEGLTDGKPDAAKMVDLVLKDIQGQGVDATAWDVRQMESRMGNLIRPSQDEISKSLRDLHSQMLVTQQMEHMLETGEMPPKTGIDRDEDSAAVRALRRERDRMMRKLGISRKTADELLKTALDAYKTRTRNQIEALEKAIADVEAGRPYEKDERRKLQLDDEAQALKEQRDGLKKRLDELTRDPAKDYEKKVERAMNSLAKAIAVRREQIAAIEAGTFDFDAKREKVTSPKLEEMRNEMKELNKRRDELKKALYPFGTDAEIARRNKQRLEAAQKSLDRWNAMAAEYEAATSWEDRAKAVAPSERRKIPETPELAEKRRIRDEARAKVAEYRRQLQRDDTRGANADAWMKFLKSVPRVFWTYLDMSVTGVQGGKFMVSHPIKGAVATAKATASFFSDRMTGRLAEEIKSHPYFDDFKKHGGHIYDMEGIGGDEPEYFEAFGRARTLPGAQKVKELAGKAASKIASTKVAQAVSKVPGVKLLGKAIVNAKPVERSRRSFSGFLNSAGLELYRSMVEAAGRDGTGATDNVKKDIAKFVNITLGWGYDKIEDEKGLVRALSEVADALAFAPRKSMAELKYFVPGYIQYTNWSGSRRHEKSGKEIRLANKLTGREQVRFLLGSLAFGICGLLIASWANGDDDDDRNRMTDILDPRSPDFGRIRIGKTSFSFLAGGDMVWRFFARLATGQKKTNGVVAAASREDVVKQYVRSRANPLLSITWDMATGKNFAGQDVSDMSAWEMATNYGLPITARAEVENFQQNDPLTALVNAVPIFFGFNKSTYERSPLDRVVAQGDEAIRMAKAAAEVGDNETAKRIESRINERGEVYGAAKGVKKIEQKIKDLEKRAKMYKYTLDRTKKGENPTLEKNYAEVVAAIENLKKELAVADADARSVYREKRKTQKWDDMSWTE